MKNKPDGAFRREAEEDFAKDFPTRNPNPEELIFMQGYKGEALREWVIAATDSVRDSNDPLLFRQNLEEDDEE